MAQKMYAVPFPGQARGFGLDWPVVGNNGVYLVGSTYGAGTETQVQLWLDTTKRPIARS
jgi:hypothetical protein